MPGNVFLGIVCRRLIRRSTIRIKLFGPSSGQVVTPKTINDRVMSLEKFLDDVEDTIIGTIFTEPVCGDEKCAAPEEYPEFQAALDARKFVGCRADCGDACPRRPPVETQLPAHAMNDEILS